MHTTSTQFLSIFAVDCIVGITVIIEFHKAKAVFDVNTTDFSIVVENILDITLVYAPKGFSSVFVTTDLSFRFE